MLRVLCLALCFSPLCAGCSVGSDMASTAPAASAVEPLRPQSSGRVHFEDSSVGIRFAMPDVGLHAETRHFDLATPPGKFKHSVTLSTLGRQRIRIDVWVNSEALPLQAWFDKYLAFTVTSGAKVQMRQIGESRGTAILVDQPPSPQSPARRLVAFAQGNKVFRFTCFDAGDTQSTEALDEILDSFDAGGAS